MTNRDVYSVWSIQSWCRVRKRLMVKIESLQEKIDKTEYLDLEILDFRINFFRDEVNMRIYNDADTSWWISFLSCYKVSYEIDAIWRGIPHVRDMKKLQLGYYGQDITISESEEFRGFYLIPMNLTILLAQIICKEVQVEKIPNASLNVFWMNPTEIRWLIFWKRFKSFVLGGITKW